MNKLVVICGPTCTGKTSLGIKLCQKFGGEIVSADSRQIYKHMDVGTGKLPVPKPETRISKSETNTGDGEIKKGDGYWVVNGTHIHLYDVVEPDKKFSVARFKDAATREIESLWRRGKIPFLVGGTGFYIAAVLGETQISRVKPNWDLRRRLEKLSVEELFEKLQELDPERAKTIDPKNPRRLVRAVEVAAGEEKSEALFSSEPRSGGSPAETLKIGLTADRKVLYQRADAWAETIVNNGLLDEVRDLVNRGYRDTEPMQGIIYQTALDHLDDKVNKEEMLQKIKFDLHGYIRRQLTWFRRDKNIKWYDISKPNFDVEVEKVVESYQQSLKH